MLIKQWTHCYFTIALGCNGAIAAAIHSLAPLPPEEFWPKIAYAWQANLLASQIGALLQESRWPYRSKRCDYGVTLLAEFGSVCLMFATRLGPLDFEFVHELHFAYEARGTQFGWSIFWNAVSGFGTHVDFSLYKRSQGETRGRTTFYWVRNLANAVAIAGEKLNARKFRQKTTLWTAEEFAFINRYRALFGPRLSFDRKFIT